MKTIGMIVAVFAAMPAAWSQSGSGPVRYSTVACLKLAPGVTAAEFEKFHEEYELKRFQWRVNAGQMLAFRIDRNVSPGLTAEESECGYVVTSVFEGFPPEVTPKALEESVRGAGIRMTAEELLAKRGKLAQLVRSEMRRIHANAGGGGRGNYRVVARFKVLNGQMNAWNNLQQQMWLPYHAERVKQGAGYFYSASSLVFPDFDGGYNAFVTMAYEDWAKLGQRTGSLETWAKVHPGKKMEDVQEQGRRLAPQMKMELYRTVLRTEPAPARPASGR
jgi:hypothetical protein